MRQEDQIPMLADIVRRMAIHADLIPRDPSDAVAVIRVAEQNYRVNEVGCGSGEEVGGVVDDLGALGVAGDAEFGGGALVQGLLDEL